MGTLLICAFLTLFMGRALTHVALTYPAARKYDLDFLDNGRTPAPCGMPKGKIGTSILKGSTLNVTWHLGYPHQGGFLLELLDEKEQHKLYLSSRNGEYNSLDTTAQRYEVKFPDDLECRGCSIRLLRQAKEWGDAYMFWSCADVDIVPRPELKRDCSGNGRHFSNRCICNKRFFGDYCQYENECISDEDCGKYGLCLDLQATSYPKRQCFCSRGYFGTRCSKSSPIRSESQVNFGIYTRRNLSDAMTLYWRILKEADEIEVVLVNKGTNFAAIGWRAGDATTACRNFPKIDGPPPPTAIKPEPEPESESKARSGTKLELKPKVKPQEVLPSAEPESEPKPKLQPKEVLPSAEPDSEPKPKLQPKEVLPSGEPESEPKPKLQPKEVLSSAEPKAVLSGRKVATLPSDPEQKTRLSLADRLANFSGGKKRRSIDGGQGGIWFTSPVLKPPSQVNRVKRNPQITKVPKAEFGSGAKPEPEPGAESESEAKPEPVVESQSKAKPEPVAESELKEKPEPLVRSESKVEPEPPAAAEVEAQPEPNSGVSGSSPYVPKGNELHAMDCTDIVVGAARDGFYRVKDYYTRDRSTPRLDEFWGGEDSITAALGWEKDGETAILFRKKLTATHPSDHSITPGLMHVIWSRGQEPNKYIHAPESGLEVGTPSIPDFYRLDELKYHGRGDQRGAISVNFFKQANNLAEEGVDWCGGQWKYPHSCSPAKNDCEYFARWEYFEKTDDIYFTISSSHSNLWTGIGFSDDTRMIGSDVVLGWVTPQGNYYIYDGWLNSYTPPTVDPKQGIFNYSASQIDGITTLNFARKRQSNDEMDLSFTDDQCLFLLFPLRGGTVNYVNKHIFKHSRTPTISSRRICIRSCTKFGGMAGNTSIEGTTKSNELQYEVEFKITGENIKNPEKGTKEYDSLANRVVKNTEGVFARIPGLVSADVVALDGNETNKLKAVVRLTLTKEAFKDSNDADVKANRDIRRIMEESLKEGRLGQLTVQPDFLRISSLRVDSLEANDSDGLDAEDGVPTNALEFIDRNKYWFIGAAIIALIILALLQACVTASMKTRRRSPLVGPKERLITNSRWKDYSQGVMNYSYERYNGENDNRRAHMIQKETIVPFFKNGVPSGPASSVHTSTPHLSDKNGVYANSRSSPSVEYGGDNSRSLHRTSRKVPLSDPRTTYSLPRGAASNSSPPPYSMAMQDYTPDFYYLPSQRKYAGEVVRVYVDYNSVN